MGRNPTQPGLAHLRPSQQSQAQPSRVEPQLNLAEPKAAKLDAAVPIPVQPSRANSSHAQLTPAKIGGGARVVGQSGSGVRERGGLGLLLP